MLATAVRKLGIATSHPLNRGLVSHFICLPGEMGGLRLRNQARTNRYASMVTVGSTRPAWSSSFGRPGGYGSASFARNGYFDQDYTGVSTYPITISAWTHSGAVTDGNMRCVACVGSDVATRGWCALMMRPNTSNLTRFGLNTDNNDAGGGTSADTNATNFTTAWHHVCGVWESATSRKLYIDGQLLATYVFSVTFNSFISTGSTWIGSLNLRGGVSFNTAFGGYIDDVRVWNRGLTATEVGQLYNLTRRGSHRTLSMFGPLLPLLVNASAGTIQDVTVSDGAKPGDTFAAAVRGAGDTSDGAKPGETFTATSRNSAAISDGGRGGDSIAGAAIGATAMSNGTVAGDAEISTSIQAAAFSNGAIIGDSQAAGKTISTSLSDGAKSGDATVQIVSINLEWAEGSKAGDESARVAVGLGIITDASKGSDSVSGRSSSLASIQDLALSGNALDEARISTAAVFNGSIASDSFSSWRIVSAFWQDGYIASEAWHASYDGFEPFEFICIWIAQLDKPKATAKIAMSSASATIAVPKSTAFGRPF